MAGYKAHLSASILPAAGLTVLSFALESLDALQAGAVFTVGVVGGFLPDLDSDTGKPLNFLLQAVSVLLPSLAYARFATWVGQSPEAVICYFAGSWLLLRYGLFALVRKHTRHRGALHSVPFVFLAAGLFHLLFLPSGKHVALIAGLAVWLTGMGHLVLDEIDAFEFKLGIVPVARKSSGTALKLWASSAGPTLLLYFLTALVYAAIFTDGFRNLGLSAGAAA